MYVDYLVSKIVLICSFKHFVWSFIISTVGKYIGAVNFKQNQDSCNFFNYKVKNLKLCSKPHIIKMNYYILYTLTYSCEEQVTSDHN